MIEMLTKKILALAVSAVAAFATFTAVPAQAVNTYSFVMFSKDGITDPEQEDATMKTALEEIGTVTLFDGGDGSASAWTAALAGKDAIVFPEGDVYSETAAMSSGAATVVKNWISNGGRAVGTGSYDHGDFIDYLTGIDRDWSDDSTDGVYTKLVSSDSLPETLPNGNYTGAITNYDEWTDAQKVNVTPIYQDLDNLDVAVAVFKVGRGSFTYYAYDWYPDNGEADTVLVAWNEALRLAASGAVESASSEVGIDIVLTAELGDIVAGAPAEVSASNLKVGTEWELVLRSTPIILESGTVGLTGSISANVNIPSGLEPGWHTITLTGVGVDGKIYKRVLRFEIAVDGTLGTAASLGDIQVSNASLANTGSSSAALALLALLMVAAGVFITVANRKKMTA